jgi:hypothetical protein
VGHLPRIGPSWCVFPGLALTFANPLDLVRRDRHWVACSQVIVAYPAELFIDSFQYNGI